MSNKRININLGEKLRIRLIEKIIDLKPDLSASEIPRLVDQAIEILEHLFKRGVNLQISGDLTRGDFDFALGTLKKPVKGKEANMSELVWAIMLALEMSKDDLIERAGNDTV